jgi:hypothetical protein
MADPLSFAMAKISLATRTVDGAVTLAEKGLSAVDAAKKSDPGRVYDEVRTLKESRGHVCPGMNYSGIQSHEQGPVESPAVAAIQNLYK